MRSCFGTIYPDLQRFQFGEKLVGKVFQIEVETRGGGHRVAGLQADLHAWQDCQKCEDFRNCHDFSNAKLQMQLTLRGL